MCRGGSFITVMGTVQPDGRGISVGYENIVSTITRETDDR